MSIQADWDDMVRRWYGGNPFLLHFWFAAYYRAYYAGIPLYIMVARDDDTLLRAAIPMVLTNRRMAGIPLKEARLLAGAHSHYNRLLLPKEEPGLLGACIDRLLADGVDLIYWEDVPEIYPNSDDIIDVCRRRLLPLEVRTVRQSPYIPTIGEFEDYRKTLSKKFRELLNNRRNRIQKAGGYEIKTYADAGRYGAAIADMEIIAAASWQGENNSGLFSGENNRQFYHELIKHTLENGYGRVFILYFKGKPAAFEFHMYSGHTEYCLKAEFSQEFDKMSPGAVLDMELVQQAFASEIQIYDLLGFEDQYKMRWTRETTPYHRYFIFGRSAAARLAYWLYFRIGNRLRSISWLRKLRNRGSRE